MLKIRLHALPAEVESAAAVIRSSFTVLEESADYPDRAGPRVRRYLTVLAPGQGIAGAREEQGESRGGAGGRRKER